MLGVSTETQSAKDIIRLLELKPHPEGGFYKETFRDGEGGERGHSTAIYYLLEVGDCSAWHRVNDAAEVWHYYAGAPLALTVSSDGHDAESHRLGPNIDFGERPQVVVPTGWWQTAESLGEWTLVGCTVAPGFEFAGFEMAPPDWRPTPRKGS
ncbi:MAG: cupin domain-containing protein [Hyphomicrobiales bacterium]